MFGQSILRRLSKREVRFPVERNFLGRGRPLADIDPTFEALRLQPAFLLFAAPWSSRGVRIGDLPNTGAFALSLGQGQVSCTSRPVDAIN